MQSLKPLSDFMTRIEKDPRIRVTHMAVYMALYQHWILNECDGPVVFVGRDMMFASKISSSVTYHKAIRALNEYGYIRYEPSFNRKGGSKVFMTSKQINH